MTRNSDVGAVKNQINTVVFLPDVQQVRFYLNSDANVDETFTLTIEYAFGYQQTAVPGDAACRLWCSRPPFSSNTKLRGPDVRP
jgi:hypothetical protein